MPNLTIIAGCNGSGKSSTASVFLPSTVPSFDYDKRFLTNYRSILDSDLREEIARNTTTKEFEQAIENAINSQQDFCYETNFDSYPVFWAKKFKEAGYRLNLIFFCLDDQEIARFRIQVRTENNGHFVSNQTIDFKWKEGYKNVNLHYRYFDNLLIVDNSRHNEIFTNLLQIEGEEIELLTENELPDYFERRFPSIYKMVRR